MKSFTIPQFVSSLRYANAAQPTPAEVAKRARFLERYPAQEANVLSYQTNPQCQCQRDLINAIGSDVNKLVNLAYIEGEQINIITPFQAIGKVITIDDTEGAWNALTQRFQTEMMMFRGMTIVPTMIDGVAKLRVFFY